jgi:hypothetical protein
MAGIKISQLEDGGNINSSDYFPVARGTSTTYKIPANKIATDGQNLGNGVGVFHSKDTGNSTTLQFRSLSGTDESLSITQVGSTIVINTSAQNPLKYRYTGNGANTSFAVGGNLSRNINNYRVDIDGVLQEPGADYNIVGSNIVFTDAPPLSSKVVIVTNNLLKAVDLNLNTTNSDTINLSIQNTTLSADIRSNSVGIVQLSAGAVPTKLGSEIGAFSFRNKIINGNMAISQRGISFSIPSLTPNIYTLDRWTAYNATTTGAFTVSSFSLGLQDVNPINDGSRYALRVVVNTADTSLSGTEHVSLVQFIEGNNIHNLLYKTFTLSFWVQSSKPGTYSVSFRNGDTVALNIDRSYVSQYTINAANTWEYKTVTVVGGIDPTVGSSWNLNEKAGLHVLFTLANATTYRTSTLNQWQNGNFIAGSSQTNIMDAINNEFYITGVQLEEGPYATPFEQRPIGTELALCQRYFQYYPGNNTNAGYTTSGTAQVVTTFLPVPMRTSPVINFTPLNVVNATLAYFDDGGSNDRVFFGVFSTSSTGGVFQYTAQNASFNAEL